MRIRRAKKDTFRNKIKILNLDEIIIIRNKVELNIVEEGTNIYLDSFRSWDLHRKKEGEKEKKELQRVLAKFIVSTKLDRAFQPD